MQDFYILAVNPGSTSMKMGVYKNEEQLFEESYSLDADRLAAFDKMKDQMDLRLEGIRTFLDKMPIKKEQLSAVASRCGNIVPIKPGAYLVNDLLNDRLLNRPFSQHASNLGGPLGTEIAKGLDIPCYVYDGVSVNEMQPLGYPTGFQGVIRQSRCHVLNMRAMLRKEAEQIGRDINDFNAIVAHLGGGITLGIFEKGRMIDLVIDTEGPLTPERSGRIPLNPLVYHCIKNKITIEQLPKLIRGKSGLAKLLCTTSVLEVEKRAKEGDKMAAFLYETMAYQVAKAIGELATVTSGKIDRIVLTGAIAKSPTFTKWVTDRVKFIAPVDVLPGEDELGALSRGVLRVLRGEEKAHIYTQVEDDWEETFKLEDLLDDFTPSM